MTLETGFKQFTRNNNYGFTLLEVLVSLTIMAMITTVAFTGLSVGIDSWHRGSRKIDELDRRFAMERVVQRQIASADHVFRGDRDQFEFSTTYSLSNGAGDPVWVKYVLEGTEFLYSETPLTQYSPDQAAPALKQTFEAASMNGFQYLYSVPGNQFGWFSETMMKGNPAAVRVDVAGDVLTIPLVNKQDESTTAPR
jgi:prepilin-type N-terminal cleavage/methylation domain-containing protein